VQVYLHRREGAVCCAGYCLNEDYPCRWVPGCHATVNGDMKGMTPDSRSCIRPCGDHDSMLQVSLKYQNMKNDNMKTCSDAVKFYGCTNSWGVGILEHCPHTCRTKECAYRCGRDELPTETGQQCWQVVERTIDQYSCARAISEGMDCHCKCGGAYLQLARAGGGSFKADTYFGDDIVAYTKKVVADEPFDVSLTGQAMRTTTVDDAWGPRLKLVVKGMDCKYAVLIGGLSGLECLAPPAGATSATTASTCVTPPTKYSPYLHRWSGLKIARCATYDVCHCNWQCDLTKNWHHAGSVELVPPVEIGAVAQAMPGCQREVPQWKPAASGPKTPVERSVKAITTISIKYYGGIKDSHKKYALEAAKMALHPLVKGFSGLLKRETPTMNDIVAEYSSRRLRETTSVEIDNLFATHEGYGRRLACDDDDAKFQEEAKKQNVLDKSCSEMLASIGDLNTMCSEASLEKAIKVGCQKTCKLCAELTTTTTTEGPTVAPDVKAGNSITFTFKITTHTDFTGAAVLGRLEFLKDDPVPYIQRLFAEMQTAYKEANLPLTDIPDRLWIDVTSGPSQVVLKEEEETETKKGFATSSIFVVVIGTAIGGSCAFGILIVCMWYLCTRGGKNSKVQPTPIQKVSKVSEGGYRVKTEITGGDVPEVKVREQDCLERLCSRCYKRCCTKKLKKAQAWSNAAEANAAGPSDSSEIFVGASVKLHGLSQAHYNGLTGTILSGPNEKGRWEVDIIIVNDDSLEEHQNRSFKADNLRVIPPPDGMYLESPSSPSLKPKQNLMQANTWNGGGGGGGSGGGYR